MGSEQGPKNGAGQKTKKENAPDIKSKSILAFCGFQEGSGLRVLLQYVGQRHARPLGAKKQRRKRIGQGQPKSCPLLFFGEIHTTGGVPRIP